VSTSSYSRIINGEGLAAGLNSQADAISFPLPPQSQVGFRSLSVFRQISSFPVMLASLLVGVVFVWARLFNVDPDMWWHIKVGETILRTHQWPTTDIYSFTVNGQPWLAYEWFGDILLAVAYRVAGLPGLVGFSILVGSAVVIALYICGTIRSGNSKAGFVTATVLSIFAVLSFSLRPQMLGYLFLVLTVIALERFRQGKHRMLWFFPAMMLLWVNTHGSWIIGMGALAVYWFSGLLQFEAGNLEAKRWSANERCQLAGIFLLSLITLPITPYGVRVAASPFEFAFSLPLNVTSIEEWQSMPFHLSIGKAFLALVLLLIVAQTTLNLRWRVEEFVLFLAGTAMACLHVRFILVFVPFAAPVFARIVSRWMPAYDAAKDKFILNAALIVLAIAAIGHFFPSEFELRQRVAKEFPVATVKYLDSHDVPEPMLNYYGFGGYLVWARGPQHKVLVDGRGDVYERGGVLSDYLHVPELKPGTMAVLRQYGIQSCLLQRDEPLSAVLYESADWKRVYTDQVSALFVRTKPWK
jgi:hypothetical protein